MRDAIEAGEKLKSTAKIFGGSILGIVTLGLSAYGAQHLWPGGKKGTLKLILIWVIAQTMAKGTIARFMT